MDDKYVSFVNVKKSYDQKHLVVKDFNLDIRKGEFVTLLGSSGSGKSTCLIKVQGKDGFDFFTQNKVSTIRVAPPQSLSAEQSAGGEQNTEEFASKGNVRSCIAS